MIQSKRRLGKGLLIAAGVVAAMADWHCGKPTGSAAEPILSVSPDTLDFGETRTSLALTIANSGKGVLDWRIQAPSEDWLSVSQSSGSVVNTPLSVDVRLNRDRAPSGQQQTTLVVTSSAGGHQQVNVQAMVADRRPLLAVGPESMHFPTAVHSQVLVIENAGAGVLTWTLAPVAEGWLQVSRSNGQTQSQASAVTVTVERSRLTADGTYTGQLVVTSDGGTRVVPVTMVVEGKGPAAVLRVAPLALSFGDRSQRQMLGIGNEGQGDLHWEASAAQGWMVVTPSSGMVAAGAAAAQVTVEADRSRLAPGDHRGAVDVVSNGGSAAVPVSVTVPAPMIFLSGRELDFGNQREVLTMSITNTGTGDLGWAFSDRPEWLIIEPAQGNTGQFPTSVRFLAVRRGLAAGLYATRVRLTSNSIVEAEIEVRVTLQVDEQPVLAVSLELLDFGESAALLELQVENVNNGILRWIAATEQAWLSLSPSSGELGLLAAETVQVKVDRQRLAGGLYTGQVTVSSNGGTRTVAVRMQVPQAPWLAVDRERLDFGEAATAQRLVLRNQGTGRLVWRVQGLPEWCRASPVEGAMLGGEEETMAVTIERLGLGAGDHATTLVLVWDGEERTVEVVMVIPENIRPVAAAGADQETIVGRQVTLDGSASWDADGEPLTYRWTQSGGPAVTLDGATTPRPGFTPVEAGVYRFALVVNDGQADSAPDEVQVNAIANTAEVEIIGEVVD